MSRNAESRFAINPTNIDISRSRFSRDSKHTTTFDAGELIPFYVDEVLPGDTFDVQTSMVVRMPSLQTPVMDNLYVDTYFFFVPNRLTWEHWKEFQGENTQSAWIPEVEYSIPQLEAPVNGWISHSIADYMGIPIDVDNISVNALPFRALGLIINEWFRDENLLDPLNVPVSDSTVTGTNGTNYITDVAKGGMPFKVAKYHDYFTSCLPAPQKGPDVTIPITTAGYLPVIARDEENEISQARLLVELTSQDGLEEYIGHFAGQSQSSIGPTNLTVAAENDPNSYEAHFTNLWASLGDGFQNSATINQLRTAFQIQKLYERDARGGTRYIEILKSHFGVTSPDYRLQRPEYLGGQRFPVSMTQVTQENYSASSPLGKTAAYSLTIDTHKDFTKSFTEHGYIIGVMCVRYPHTYSYGIERFWSRKQRFDFYMPVFANLGEMAVLNKEIYAQGTSEDDEVFGYQEAWADYRYKPNRVSGLMRPQATGTLAYWNLADEYTSLPRLSADWINEDKSPVNRVIAVQNQPQFLADIYVKNNTTRAMPVYSIPGLIDHH